MRAHLLRGRSRTRHAATGSTSSPGPSAPTPELPDVTLPHNRRMPAVGYGVGRGSSVGTTAAVTAALDAGHRLISTAAAYGNEHQVGLAVARSSVERDDVFLSSTLSRSDYGYDAALRGFEASAARLGVQKIDLYLLDHPLRSSFTQTVDAFRALARLQAEGRVGAIGVSDFGIADLDELEERTGVVPAVNRIEVHPHLPRPDLLAEHERRWITTQARAPFGAGDRPPVDGQQHGSVLTSPVVVDLARTHAVPPAQVVLRWHLQRGVATVVGPDTVRSAGAPSDVLAFELSDDEMDAMARLASPGDGRLRPELAASLPCAC